MQDPLVILNIAERADVRVLELLAKTPIWNSISPLLSDQSFWFRRLELRMSLPPYMQWQGNERENWYQIYNIIVGFQDLEGNPFDSRAGLEVLRKNGYNTLAIRYLLTQFNPSVRNSALLSEAARYGSPELIRLLLADPRITLPAGAPVESEPWIALWQAARRGSIPVIQALLEDSRMSDPRLWTEALNGAAIGDKADAARYLLSLRPYTALDLSKMATTAVENDSADVFELIDEDPIFTLPPGGREELITSAIKHSSQNVVRYMLTGDHSERWIPDEERAAFSITAITSDQPEILQLLSTSIELDHASKVILQRATEANATSVLSLILLNETLASDDIARAIQVAVDNGKSQSLRRLILDSRSERLDYLLTGMVGLPSTPSDVEVELVRNKHTRLSSISSVRLIRAGATIAQAVRDNGQGATLLSGLSGQAVDSHTTSRSDYSIYHFGMLVREILFKRDTQPMPDFVPVKRERLGYDYFLNWIIEHANETSTRADTRDLIASAAAAVLTTKPTIHTSPDFTAYYGFFLLPFSGENGWKVMEQLRLEQAAGQGVTDEGIQKAGLLVGAYLGKRALDDEQQRG